MLNIKDKKLNDVLAVIDAMPTHKPHAAALKLMAKALRSTITAIAVTMEPSIVRRAPKRRR